MKKAAALVEERVGLGRKIRAGPQGKTARWKKKKKTLWAGLGWFSYFLSLSYFFSFQTSLKLIEFKLRFEFKPYALNQIKFMHQHECTNMLT